MLASHQPMSTYLPAYLPVCVYVRHVYLTLNLQDAHRQDIKASESLTWVREVRPYIDVVVVFCETLQQ